MRTLHTEKWSIVLSIHVFYLCLLKQMSDPLTALMHAVQVMNLLKTLIMKTLREREETATGGYSPMSFRSSDRRSEDEFGSQREMDTSGELRGTKSDYDDHAHYSHNSSEEEGEAESLSEIEECFLKQLGENTKGFSEEEPAGYLQEEYVSPRSCSGYSVEPASISITDSKTGNSCLGSSEREKMRSTMTGLGSNADTTSSRSVEWTGTKDVEMVDKFTDSVSAVTLLASS